MKTKRPKFIFLLFTIGLSLHGCATSSPLDTTVINQLTDYPYTLQFESNTYSGLYNGEAKNNIPSGQGSFQSDYISGEAFTYSGNFQNGLPSGKGTLSYADGSYYAGSFKNGKKNSSGTLNYPDGSYTKMSYSSGIPVGVCETYDSDKKLIDFDYYYKGNLISSLTNQAISPSYRDLYNNYQLYMGEILEIPCKVAFISDSLYTRTLKLVDASGNIYITTFSDNVFSTTGQAIIPNLSIGDTITIYGYYLGINTYISEEDPENSGFSFPEIEAFHAVFTIKKAFDRSTTTLDYETITLYPYHCYKRHIPIRATINNILVGHGYKTYYLDVTTNTGYQYYVYVPASLVTKLPIPGDQIVLKGTLNGQYKYSDNNGTIQSLPYLYAYKIKIVES